jgi:hypothetical protein
MEQGGSPVDPGALSAQMRALSDSLDQSGDAPASARQNIARAQKELSQGHTAAASGALNDALQDLQDMEGMVGDEEMLGNASKDIRSSASRVAEQPPSGGADNSPQAAASPNAPAPQASGPNAPVESDEPGPPAPPGPNQGSLPGQGSGRGLGAPTPRLRIAKTPVTVPGVQGQGPSTVREIVAPGRVLSPQIAPSTPSPAVARETDRAMSQAPLPPAYVTLVREYFEMLGGSP